MTWDEDKDLGPGPWNFTEQPNKWGYLNNPRWTAIPTAPVNYDSNPEDEPQVWEGNPIKHDDNDSDEHNPCGHWHKRIVPGNPFVNANLYGIYNFGTPANIWAANFNAATRKLTYSGVYASPSGDINGLSIINNQLVTVGGLGATAELRAISLIPDPSTKILPLEATFTPFNQYDIQDATQFRIRHWDDLGGLWVYGAHGTGTGGIVKLNKTIYSRENRYFPGTVIQGTDLNYYVMSYPLVASGWGIQPINALWTTYYVAIQDNLFDSPLSVYLGGNSSTTSGTWDLWYSEGFLYCAFWKSPRSRLKKFNPADFSILADISIASGLDWPYRVKAWGGLVHTACGFNAAKIITYDTSLSKIYEVVLDGRFNGMNGGDIIECGGYLIAGTVDYVTLTGTLYMLSPSSGEIINSTIPLNEIQRMVKIDDTFFAVASNTGVEVYELPSLNLVDSLNLGPYVTSYSTQQIVSNVIGYS